MNLGTGILTMQCIACGSTHHYTQATLQRGASVCGCGQPLDPAVRPLKLPSKRVNNAQARNFLEQLANLGAGVERKAGLAELAKHGYPSQPDIPSDYDEKKELNAVVEVFLGRFKCFFHEGFPELNFWTETNRMLTRSNIAREDPRQSGIESLLGFRNHLQACWRAPDTRTREWMCFQLREYGQRFSLDPRVKPGVHERRISEQPPSVQSPVDQALLYLLKHAAACRRCRNSDCPSPYFFAHRSRQQFCSEKCALPAQREHKRNWWREHGAQWRKESREKIKAVIAPRPRPEEAPLDMLDSHDFLALTRAASPR